MSVMIEIWLANPIEQDRESAVEKTISDLRGKTTFRENDLKSTVLTIEFTDLESANQAEPVLRKLSDHLEGPMEYGDD